MGNNWQWLTCLVNTTGLPSRLAPAFWNEFNVSCPCTKVCIALALLTQLETTNGVSIWCSKFRLQSSQEFLSSFAVNGLCCSGVSGSIPACADRWMGLKAGSQDRSVQSSLFFPVVFADAAPFWFKSLQICWLAKFSAPGNFLTKFSKNSCSKNLIFQFLEKHVYSSHYCGIMWKMYKIYQCYICFLTSGTHLML